MTDPKGKTGRESRDESKVIIKVKDKSITVK